MRISFKDWRAFVAVIAAIVLMHIIELTLDLGVLFALIVATVAVVMTWSAALSARRTWMALAIVMPLAGLFEADPQWKTMTTVLYATFGVFVLMYGRIKRRF